MARRCNMTRAHEAKEMERLARFALGYYLFGVGLLIFLAPWTPLWSRNYFVNRSGPLASLLLSPWARGALSGVGALYVSRGVLDTLRTAAHRGDE